MSADDETLIEHIARYMCTADGADPDEAVVSYQGVTSEAFTKHKPRWQQYHGAARQALVSHRAVAAALSSAAQR